MERPKIPPLPERDSSPEGKEDTDYRKVIMTSVVLVCLIIIIVNVMFFLSYSPPSCSCTIPIRFVTENTGAHNWTLEISANNISPHELKYAIISVNGTILAPPTSFPMVSGVPDSNGVTWIDTDNNGKVNTGDVLIIDNPTINSGDRFRIVAGATGEVELP